MRDVVLRTLAYFDIFDYPLTTFELWKFLRTDTPYTFVELTRALDDPSVHNQIETASGYWFLRGREVILGTRLERYKIAERKYRMVLRAARFLRLIPSVRMVAVCNTLALSHSRDGADIDLFIVSAPGALWWSRLLAVVPFALLGLRPTPRRERDRFCFSFFATETALDLASLCIRPDDPYLLYWIATLVPVYDPDGLIEAVWEANPWVARALPQARPVATSQRRRGGSRARVHHTLESRTGLLETCARALQLLRLPLPLRALMNRDHRVIVTDELLKFHENDRREEFREAFQARCHLLGL